MIDREHGLPRAGSPGLGSTTRVQSISRTDVCEANQDLAVFVFGYKVVVEKLNPESEAIGYIRCINRMGETMYVRKFSQGIVLVSVSLTLAACSSSGTGVSSEVEGGVDPIRDACSEALRVASSESTLPALTQCEVQLGGSKRIFVLQFADPVEDRQSQGNESSYETLFYEPLSALRAVWSTAQGDGKIDTFVVAFQDSCQTVWDLDSSLVDGFIGGSLNEEELTNSMEISSMPC